jgi:hypothetical protein
VRRALALLVLALAAAGCGGSSANNGAVSRAADVTAKARGFRLAGVLTVGGPASGTFTEAMSGSFDRADQRGSVTTIALVGGRRIQTSELLSRLTVYVSSAAIPNGVALTGGKQWIELNLSRAGGAIGVSSLPTATDPTQFVDFLRAVSSTSSSAGGETVRGVPTTHYHAIVDLDRYPSLVPPSELFPVTRSVKALESALGAHTIPLDVWVDSKSLVRRLSFSLGECISRTRFQFGMSLDLFDYGPQPRPRLPTAREAYDITPVIAAALRQTPPRCG